MKFLLIFFAFITVNSFSQGKIDGFYRGQGNLTTVLGFGFEDYKSYFAGREKLDLQRTAYYASLFSSYGITKNLDGQISIPYIESDDNKNLQDLSVFVKYRFLSIKKSNHNIGLSLGSGLSTPLSNYKVGGLYDIGQQATVLDLRIMTHYEFNNTWFLTAQTGYSFKSNPTPNSIPFTLKMGFFKNGWYYDVYYDYQHSYGGIDYRGTPSPQDFRALGVDFNKVGSTIFKSFNRFGAYASASYLLPGRNSFEGPSFGLGLTYDIKKTH